jgi:hypothetical protein
VTEIVTEAGALFLWRREMQRGDRKASTWDRLWHAACLEARAAEDIRAGLIESGNEDRLRAAELIVEHFAERAA